LFTKELSVEDKQREERIEELILMPHDELADIVLALEKEMKSNSFSFFIILIQKNA